MTITIEETQPRAPTNMRPSAFKKGAESARQRELNSHQIPIFDVLIFGEKSVGKKLFMQRANEAQQIELKKTLSRDEHFKFYDYIKM